MHPEAVRPSQRPWRHFRRGASRRFEFHPLQYVGVSGGCAAGAAPQRVLDGEVQPQSATTTRIARKKRYFLVARRRGLIYSGVQGHASKPLQWRAQLSWRQSVPFCAAVGLPLPRAFFCMEIAGPPLSAPPDCQLRGGATGGSREGPVRPASACAHVSTPSGRKLPHTARVVTHTAAVAGQSFSSWPARASTVAVVLTVDGGCGRSSRRALPPPSPF